MDINYKGLTADGNSTGDLFSTDAGLSLQELDEELLKTIDDNENNSSIENNYNYENEDISTESDELEELFSEDINEDLDDIDSGGGDIDLDIKIDDDSSYFPELDDINFAVGIKGKDGNCFGADGIEDSFNGKDNSSKKFFKKDSNKESGILNNNPIPQVFPSIKDTDLQHTIKQSQGKKIVSINQNKNNSDKQSKKEYKKSKKKKETIENSKNSEPSDKTIKACLDLLSKKKSDLYELCSAPEAIFQKEENPTYDINENGLIEETVQINTNKYSASIDYINNLNNLKKPPTAYKSDNIASPVILTKSKSEESNTTKNKPLNTDRLNIEGALKLKRHKKQNYLLIILITISIMISLLFLLLVFQ